MANVKFFSVQAGYWFVATCWEGHVAFFSLPQSQKGREFLTCKKVQSYHKRDVTCVDVTRKNNLVTASVDNLICFWNTFNGTITKKVTIPSHIIAPMKGNSICYLKFADFNSNEMLLVFMNEGEVLCLDAVSESFV